MDAQTESAKQPATAFQKDPAALSPPSSGAPALGIIIAVIVSTLIWPVLALIWIYG